MLNNELPNDEWIAKAKDGDRKYQLLLGDWEMKVSNYRDAFKWYKLAAEDGHADALYNLGIMYDGGKGVQRDKELALKLFEESAVQGYPYAKSRLRLIKFKRKCISKMGKVILDHNKIFIGQAKLLWVFPIVLLFLSICYSIPKYGHNPLAGFTQIIVTGASIYFCFLCYKKDQRINAFFLIYSLAAIVYNPIIKLYIYGEGYWIFLNSVFFLVFSICFLLLITSIISHKKSDC